MELVLLWRVILLSCKKKKKKRQSWNCWRIYLPQKMLTLLITDPSYLMKSREQRGGGGGGEEGWLWLPISGWSVKKRKKNKSWLRCHQRSERDIQVKAKHTVTFDVTPLRWWHLRVGAGCERSDRRGVCLCKVSERSWSWKRRELQQKDSGNWRLPWTPAM